MSVVSLADLYGGKICAALDRQHPRDLFDVLNMLEKPGPMREIFDGFVIWQAIPAPLPSCWPQTGIQSGSRRCMLRNFRG